MIILFTLSMPNVGSWNGKWTGESNLHAKVYTFRTKKEKENGKKILNQKYFHYDFGDGWSAGINVKQIDSYFATKIKRKIRGFCGYEWMVKSIIDYGKIKILNENRNK